MKKQNPILFTALSSAILLSSIGPAIAGKEYPKIYPFVPFSPSYIETRVQQLSEDKKAVTNFYDIIKQNLSKKASKEKPWTSTYWPLNKGLIANPYADNFLVAYNPVRLFSWEYNHKRLDKRKKSTHRDIDEFSSEELDFLAPSEKYDLLMGDKSFDLTNRLVDYMQKWGSKKEFGNLSNLDVVGGTSLEHTDMLMSWGWTGGYDNLLETSIGRVGGLAEHLAKKMVKTGEYASFEAALPRAIKVAEKEKDNYVLEKKNSLMATWEGICHGWSVAAGNVPRPRKTVTFTLPDGRDLRFFPEDIKGLVSLLWANSLIQDGRWYDNDGNPQGGGVMMQGLRCNKKRPAKDEWGRLYDNEKDFYSGKLEPRCVGVHPALWHLSLVNIIGKQGRSFIVERKVKAAVDNHPLYKYKFKYFNPITGRYSKDIGKVVEPVSKEDVFREFRAKETRYIVGVRATMSYLDWERPKREKSDSEKDDSNTDISMLYDLELDENGKIVGGQWRAVEKGKPKRNLGPRKHHGQKRDVLNHKQPDFFWVVTKDWKPFFKETQGLSNWADTSKAPPADWLKAAHDDHAFEYQQTHEFGIYNKCKMFHKDTGEMIQVPCEFKINKPQPLLNVMNVLVNLAK